MVDPVHFKNILAAATANLLPKYVEEQSWGVLTARRKWSRQAQRDTFDQSRSSEELRAFLMDRWHSGLCQIFNSVCVNINAMRSMLNVFIDLQYSLHVFLETFNEITCRLECTRAACTGAWTGNIPWSRNLPYGCHKRVSPAEHSYVNVRQTWSVLEVFVSLWHLCFRCCFGL